MGCVCFADIGDSRGGTAASICMVVAFGFDEEMTAGAVGLAAHSDVNETLCCT